MAEFDPRDPEYAARVRRSFGRQGAMRLMGAELSRVEPGEVEIASPFRPEVSQQHGFFHGGVVAALLPFGVPMGFVAILGILALIGILIRNSVILVHEIQVLIGKGQPWLNTQAFLAKLDENLQKKMG